MPISESAELGVLSQFVERNAYTPTLNDDKLPKDFPTEQWNAQSERYAEYWKWYSGDALANTRTNERNETESQYPLHINSLRTIVRKHASVLFGEVPDGPAPLVKTTVRPRKRFDANPIKEEDKKLAAMCESIINEVWTASNGRAMQLENGKYSQFLGGSVFQISYRPRQNGLVIPLVITNPRPDFYLPEWSNEDRWSLLRGTTMYEIPAPVAKMQYGVGDGKPGETALYMQIETKTSHTIKVDGQSISYEGKLMDNTPHNFGAVTSVYIPHQLDGATYGSSHVEDIAALLKEYNARFSDFGAAVLNSVERETFLSNVIGEPSSVTLPNGRKVTSLGVTPPASGSKDAPKAMQEEAPVVNESMVKILDMIFRQILRECDMSYIPFGEDEGSQRSGQTLALRMWPILAHTRQERTLWNDGMSRIGWYILKMVKTIMEDNPKIKASLSAMGIDIPNDYEQRIEIATEWSPQIPQDREKLVQEVVQLLPVGAQSRELVVRRLGDAKDVQVELDAIEKQEKAAADLASQQQSTPFGNKSNDSGAPKSKEPATKPVATS